MKVSYTPEQLEQIEKERQFYIEKGHVKVCGKNIIELLRNYKLQGSLQGIFEYTTESYLEYIDELLQLPEELQKKFLKVLKNADIIDNQSLEKEDSFLISLYLQSTRKHAIDLLLCKDNLTKQDILDAHGLLMKGTSTEDSYNHYKFRQNNGKFVGVMEQGQRIIQYLPIDYRDIDSVMDSFLEYYNSSDENSDDIFQKPFNIHAMIAALQVFDDGNTRLARLLQHDKIYDNTKDKVNISSPALYITRSYYPFRGQYRELIKDLVVNADEQSVEDWLKFNLRSAQTEIDQKKNQLQKIKKM